MSEVDKPRPGQLRGIGIRPDPQAVLIAPHVIDGEMWGYTILDKTQPPAIYMDDDWQEFVPKGVWIQMLENWEQIRLLANDTFSDFPVYLDYPEIRKLII